MRIHISIRIGKLLFFDSDADELDSAKHVRTANVRNANEMEWWPGDREHNSALYYYYRRPNETKSIWTDNDMFDSVEKFKRAAIICRNFQKWE